MNNKSDPSSAKKPPAGWTIIISKPISEVDPANEKVRSAASRAAHFYPHLPVLATPPGAVPSRVLFGPEAVVVDRGTFGCNYAVSVDNSEG